MNADNDTHVEGSGSAYTAGTVAYGQKKDDDEEFAHQLEQERLEKLKQSGEYSNPYIHVDPNDGTEYEWDHEKQAWFPKITQDFLAAYQANYCYTDEQHSSTQQTSAQQEEQAAKQKGKPSEPGWFEIDDAHNTKVYVTGVPQGTTEEEFIELMNKCGLIMKNEKNQMKVKLYRNADGTLKGDGLCHYIKVESVELALSILDGYRYKDSVIHVERAKFQMKGSYDPTKKPKKKKQKEKEKMQKKLDKLFDWRPDKLRGMRGRNEKTVIIKNMFDPKEFEKDPGQILEYQRDLREECSKCGEVKKVVVYDRHPEGVAAITFSEPEEADECIQLMNRRWFAQRQLVAETWDGKTKYRIVETEEQLEARLQKWEDYLEDGEEGDGKKELQREAVKEGDDKNESQQPGVKPKVEIVSGVKRKSEECPDGKDVKFTKTEDYKESVEPASSKESPQSPDTPSRHAEGDSDSDELEGQMNWP